MLEHVETSHSAQPQRTILIISYDFPPRAARSAVRTASIARFLAENDWKVFVLCCAPDGTVRRDEVWAAHLEECGVHIVKTKTISRVEMLSGGHVKTFAPALLKIRRWFSQWSAQPDVYTSWRKEAKPLIDDLIKEHSINMLFASAPPFSNVTLTQEVAEESNIPFAFDYGDVWQGNPAHSLPTPIHRKRSSGMEMEALRKAAVILSSTRRTKEDLLRRFRFLNHEEIMIVPHGFNADELEGLQAEPSEQLLITAYQDFYPNASPKPMLKALRTLLTKRPELRSRIHVSIIGIVREQHRRLISKWRLGDVVSVNALADRLHSLNVMSSSDVLWYCSQTDSEAASPVVGDYLGCAKALLMTCPNGTTLSTAREYARVFHAQPTSVQGIVSQLEAIIDVWKSGGLESTATQRAKANTLNYASTLREVSRVLGMNMRL